MHDIGGVKSPTTGLSIVCILCLLFAGMALTAQDTSAPTPTAASQPAADEATPPANPVDIKPVQNRLATLKALLASMRAKQAEVRRLETQLEASTNDIEREDISRQLEASAGELVQLQREFERTASSVDSSIFNVQEDKPFSWEDQVGQLVKPVLSEMEKATEKSRRIANLRDDLEAFSERKQVANNALNKLDELLSSVESRTLEAELLEQKRIWTDRKTVAENQAEASRLRLESLEAERENLLDSSTSYVKNFFGTRGLNLILAVFAFCVVFFGVRISLWLWRKTSRSTGPQRLGNRVISLAVHLASIFGAVLAVLLVLNLRSDWFLLGLTVIFLLGVAWASLNTIPKYVDAVILILNVGPVREGERVVYDDLPWKVETLNFSCRLVNDRLDGGLLRIPVRHMVDMVSRPFGDDELLFPTVKGDWVELADERIGEVISQNPCTVTLRELGGAEIHYQTADFLAQTPRNMSCGFRIETRFGVDYGLQDIATQEIPEKMEARLKEKLPAFVDEQYIRIINVEFACAAASSLEYEIEVDLDGKAAEDYEIVEFALQRILVETCTENGWTIPFNQLTVHRAEGGTA